MSEFVVTASKFLKACGVKVDTIFFEQRLTSHPDYPALTALTDTLDELGITYSALLADKERLEELQFPALFHTQQGVIEDFEIVTSPKELRGKKDAVITWWDGIVLTIAPGSIVQNTGHKKIIDQKRKSYLQQTLFVTGALILSVICLAIHFSPWLFSFALLSISGIFICSLIILHRLGKANDIVQQICSTSAQNGCDKVLQSKGGEVFGKNIGLGDIGLVYFAGVVLFSTISAVTNQTAAALSLLAIPVTLSIPAVAWSLFYQYKVVKAWCRMCLMVAGILLLQAAIVTVSVTYNGIILNSISPSILLISTGCFVLPASWFFMAGLMRKVAHAEFTAGDLVRWKRDPDIFLLRLKQGMQVKKVALAGDIILGNADAPLQVLIVSSPLCNPCAQAHAELEHILAAHPQDVGLTTRFTFNHTSGVEDDQRKEVAKLIFEACRREQLHNNLDKVHPVDAWFKEMNIEKFRERYLLPANPDVPEEILQQQSAWCREQNIMSTPTIYINGYRMPRQWYTISDIGGLLPSLSDRLAITLQEEQPAFINH